MEIPQINSLFLPYQVGSVISKLSSGLSITMCLCVGGTDIRSQEANVRASPDILVATPGRLIDLLYNTPTFSLDTIEIFVIDEADRLVVRTLIKILIT